MKVPKRLTLFAPIALWIFAESCVVDNDPSYEGILGITRPPPEDGSLLPSGSGGTGGFEGSSSDGVAMSAGGAPGGEGGMGEGGEGADAGNSGGTGGSGGTTGIVDDNPPIDPNYSPACFEQLSQGGEEIKKGTPCSADDPQECYRPCGPNQVGWKTETCLASVYAEGDCTFPDYKDYSCYAIPDEIDTVVCGLSAPPSATDECSAPLCTPCNFEGQYQDTGDNVKNGYCVCREPDQDGVRRWTCASDTAWPCPLSKGC